MKILVLNGSPHSKGTVAALLEAVVQPLREGHEIEWLDVCSLTMKHCSGCMVCREKNECVLPADDAHRVGAKIREADVLVIGTPTHWGNMSAPLKQLFDRNVPVFMGESARGMPLARQKGKRAVVVTACTTPWPFNVILPESRGALRAVGEVLHYGGYKTVGTLTRPGSKRSAKIPPTLLQKARKLGLKLARS